MTSTASHSDLQPAVVLHRRAYRDSSLLVEVFTASHGRLGLVARGARRPKSALAGVLQPFSSVLLAWRGRGDLGTLTHGELAAPAPEFAVMAGTAQALTSTADNLAGAYYVCELVMRLCHRHDPHPALFAPLVLVIAELAASSSRQGVECALRRFEKVLLQQVGYGLVLDREAGSGAPIVASARYRYLPQAGAIALAGESGGPAGPMAAAQDRQGHHERSGEAGVPVSGATLLALANDDLSDEKSRAEAKLLMRTLLQVHLGERPLRSRALYQGTRPPAQGTGGAAASTNARS